MQLSLRDDLPFVTTTIAYQNQVIDVENVLVDTGSATTLLSADIVAGIHIVPRPEDEIHMIRGVGGIEAVYSRIVDYVQLGNCKLPELEIEIGGMDYGFEINGILGMDFLLQTGAMINLQEMQIEFTDR